MSLLLDSALANNNLKYIDATGEHNDILLEEIITENTTILDQSEKSLTFLYVDNSINSISIFWLFMQSKHCIALLSDSMAPKFKIALEKKYKPKYIFDKERNDISGYKNRKIGPYDIKELKNPINYLIDEKIKILLSTSGTTGSPKFVKLSEKNLIENTSSICNYLPINKQDVTPLNLPINYSYGLSVLLTNSLKGGNIICSVPDILQREFWDALENYGFTSIAGVPFVYEMLDRFGFTKKFYKSLKYLSQAGGKLKDELVEKFGHYALENNMQFFVMYGATEASARMSYLEPHKVLTKKGSIGKPIKNGAFALDKDTSELIYDGPNVFGGYANNLQDLSHYDESNILRTGDIARKDSDGYYYIVGRIKRFVKISGLRINLDEVEGLIFSMKQVPVKCIGYNDEQLVVFLEKNDLDIKKLKKQVSSELKIHNSFIRFNEISKFPLTSNGKIDYKKLETYL